MSLGAYYRSVANQPIPEPQLQGLGTQDQFAVTSLQEILASSAVKPAAAVAPWGIQDGSVDWQTEQPDHTLLLYPVHDSQLAEVQKATFGVPVPALAVLTTAPVQLSAADEAFDNTPYRFESVEGVYRLDDAKAVPTIYFLYWGQYREPSDGGGGNSSLQSAASMLGGTLVFPLQVARAGQLRPHPSVSFQAALAAQLSSQPKAAVSPTATATAVQQPALAAPAQRVPWWVVTLVGGAAAYGGYRWWKGRKAG